MSSAKNNVYFRKAAAPASNSERDYFACPETYSDIEQWERECAFVNVNCWLCGLPCKESVSRFPTAIPIDVKQTDSKVEYRMKGSFHSWSCMVNWTRLHCVDSSKLIRRAQQIYQSWGGKFDLQIKIGLLDPTQMQQFKGSRGITKDRFNSQLI